MTEIIKARIIEDGFVVDMVRREAFHKATHLRPTKCKNCGLHGCICQLSLKEHFPTEVKVENFNLDNQILREKLGIIGERLKIRKAEPGDAKVKGNEPIIPKYYGRKK